MIQPCAFYDPLFSALEPSGRPASARSAFTVLELLVVIAIVGVLAGMLLPVLARAKGKGQSTACLNNLRQLGTAWFMYAIDNADELVPSISDGSANLPGSWVLGNAQSGAAKNNITTGLLYPLAGELATYRCPSDRSTLVNSQAPRLRSYTLNGWLHSAMPVALVGDVGFDFNDFLAERQKYGQIQIPGPVGVMTFIEEHPDGIDDGLWTFTHTDDYDNLKADGTCATGISNYWDSLPSDRHNQGANLSFADGHAVYHHWKGPKIFDSYWIDANPDLEDLRYLQSLLPRFR